MTAEMAKQITEIRKEIDRAERDRAASAPVLSGIEFILLVTYLHFSRTLNVWLLLLAALMLHVLAVTYIKNRAIERSEEAVGQIEAIADAHIKGNAPIEEKVLALLCEHDTALVEDKVRKLLDERNTEQDKINKNK